MAAVDPDSTYIGARLQADQRIKQPPAARSLYRSRVFLDRKPLKLRSFLENDR